MLEFSFAFILVCCKLVGFNGASNRKLTHTHTHIHRCILLRVAVAGAPSTVSTALYCTFLLLGTQMEMNMISSASCTYYCYLFFGTKCACVVLFQFIQERASFHLSLREALSVGQAKTNSGP